MSINLLSILITVSREPTIDSRALYTVVTCSHHIESSTKVDSDIMITAKQWLTQSLRQFLTSVTTGHNSRTKAGKDKVR